MHLTFNQRVMVSVFNKMQKWVISFLVMSILTLTSSIAEEENLITLNMKDADITTFIADIAQMTDKSFEK